MTVHLVLSRHAIQLDSSPTSAGRPVYNEQLHCSSLGHKTDRVVFLYKCQLLITITIFYFFPLYGTGDQIQGLTHAIWAFYHCDKLPALNFFTFIAGFLNVNLYRMNVISVCTYFLIWFIFSFLFNQKCQRVTLLLSTHHALAVGSQQLEMLFYTD